MIPLTYPVFLSGGCHSWYNSCFVSLTSARTHKDTSVSKFDVRFPTNCLHLYDLTTGYRYGI